MYLSKNKIKLLFIISALILIIIFTANAIFGTETENTSINSGSIVYKADTETKIICVTVEVNENTDDYTDAILDVLSNSNIKATFFLTGKWVESNKDLAKRIAQEGHEIGNHSYSHSDMKKMLKHNVEKEIANADSAISSVYNKEINLFKPPYSYINEKIISAAEKKDKTVVLHSLDSMDWKSSDVDFIINNLKSGIKPGDIICFHNDAKFAPEALDDVIKSLAGQGYKFVTAGEILNIED